MFKAQVLNSQEAEIANESECTEFLHDSDPEAKLFFIIPHEGFQGKGYCQVTIAGQFMPAH